MIAHMRFAVLLFFIGLLSRAAMAVTIVNYSPAQFDRFSSGYPSSPVPNTDPSFIGLNYDWSGVGWSAADSTQSFAMINDQYFVYADHYGSATSISFFSPALSAVVPMAVDTSYSFQPLSKTLGIAGDLRIGRLAAPISSALGITSYPVLLLDTLSAYLGQPLFVYGHGPTGMDSTRIGTNVIDYLGEISGTGFARSYAVGYDFGSSPTGEAMLQGGDSGSPLFVPWYGSLALVGIHTGIDSVNVPPSSYDTFIPDYLDSISSQASQDNFSFETVPEPSCALLLMMGLFQLIWCRSRLRVVHV